MKKEHFFFNSNGHKLYGMLFEPINAREKAESYIILHPFAEEKKSSQKVLVDLARRVCEKGNTVLVFDFFGCGDSEGDLQDACLSIWLEDLNHAVIFLKKQTNNGSVNLIGLRLGGFIAMLYNQSYQTIHNVVLIEPVIDPIKDFKRSLRSKLMKELCTDGEIVSNRDHLLNHLDNDISIDFSGHEISSLFYKDLLNLSDYQLEGLISGFSGYCLLINVSPMGKPTREFQRLVQKLENHHSVQFEIIKLDPFWGQIDSPDCSGLIEKVVEWSRIS